MGNLASNQLTTQSDPEVVRRQILADREKQLSAISNPQQQLAARLGGLLGGGLTNLYQDKGFFEVNDPLLTKVSKIQGIYNEVASTINPAADPVKFYAALQGAYSKEGLGKEALAASQEGLKFKASGLDLQIKENLLLEKSPEYIATKLAEATDPAEIARLTGMQKRMDEDRELTLKTKRTSILKDEAYIAYQKALSEQGKFTVTPIDPTNPLAGDRRVNTKTGEIDYPPVPQSIIDRFANSATKPKDGKGDKAKPDPAGFDKPNANPAAVNVPAQQTSWSGVPVNPKPATAISPMQERDFAIQRAYPTIPVMSLTEEAKAQLAQQMGL